MMRPPESEDQLMRPTRGNRSSDSERGMEPSLAEAIVEWGRILASSWVTSCPFRRAIAFLRAWHAVGAGCVAGLSHQAPRRSREAGWRRA
jgi:hypothetical protein